MTASLAISIAALVISLAVAGWNVLKYILDGGRVRVRLRVGRLDEHSLAAYSFRAGYPSDDPRVAAGRSTTYLEVGVLRVENLGRTGVTIEDAAFDLGGQWNWQRTRFQRHTVRTTPLKFRDSSIDNVVRVEPFDFVDYILDAEGAIAAASETKRRRVRGSVYVAGKRLKRRSTRRDQWRVAPGARTLTGEEPTVQEVVFRELLRGAFATSETDLSAVPGYTAEQFAKRWEATPSEDRLSSVVAILQEVAPSHASQKVVASALAISMDLSRLAIRDEQAQTADARSPRPDPPPRADT